METTVISPITYRATGAERAFRLLLAGFTDIVAQQVLATVRTQGGLLTTERVMTPKGLFNALKCEGWDLMIVQGNEGGLLTVVAGVNPSFPVIVMVEKWDDPALMGLTNLGCVDLVPQEKQAGLPFALARALRVAKVRRQQKNVEVALNRNVDLVRALTEDLPLGVLFLTTDGHCTYANPGAQALLELGLPQCLGKGWMQGVHPADRDAVLTEWRELLSRQSPHLTTFRVNLGDGRLRWIRARSVPVYRSQNSPGEQVVTLVDITQILETQAALLKRVQLDELLVTLSAELFNGSAVEVNSLIVQALGRIGEWADVDRGYLFRFSSDGQHFSNTHEWCNTGITLQQPRLQDLPVSAFEWFVSRIRREEVVSVPDVAALPAAAAAERAEFEREGIRSLVAVPLKLGNAVVGFLGFDACRHQQQWPAETIDLLRLAGNLLIEALAHHQTEQTLTATRFCVDHLPDPVLWITADGRLLGANEAAARSLGRSRADLLQVTVADIEVASLVPWTQHWEQARSATTHSFESRFQRLNGSSFPAEVTVNYLDDYQGQPCVCVIIRDVTERQRAAAIATRLAAVVQQATECVVITDPEWNIEYANPAFNSQTGYPAAELAGRPLPSLQADSGDSTFRNEVTATLREGNIWRGRCNKRRKDGSIFVSEGSVSPIRNRDGQVTHYVMVSRDVTRELEYEQRVVRLQRMEALGRLAGGVAHDFNNLLTIIVGSAAQGLASTALPMEARHDFERIRDAAARATGLTRHLLALSGKQVLEIHSFDLNSIVQRLQPSLRRLLGTDIDLSLQLDAKLPLVKADSHHIAQALLNFAIYARETLVPSRQEEKPRLTIATSTATITTCDSDVLPGSYVLLQVADNSTGLSEEIKQLLFEPFSTQLPGQGAGLGLASVYGIVTQSGGQITVDSVEGHGTVFSIWLPPGTTAETAAAQASVAPTGTHPKVLLVEDEPVLRELAHSVLVDAGYQVHTAANAEEALEWFHATGHPAVDLLVSDIMLPGLDGPTMAARLRQLHPGLRLLFTSGYADPDPRAASTLRGAAFLPKPYTPSSLLHKVGSLFGSSAAGTVGQ